MRILIGLVCLLLAILDFWIMIASFVMGEWKVGISTAVFVVIFLVAAILFISTSEDSL